MKFPDNKPAEQLFNQFCEGYKNRDLPLLLSLFTKNTNMWGSGVDEYRVGLKEVEAQLKRDWSQSEQGKIDIINFVPTQTDALWAAALCNACITIDGTEYLFEQLRGTIMIEKEKDTWKISHMHCSFPDYRNPDNGSFPVEE